MPKLHRNKGNANHEAKPLDDAKSPKERHEKQPAAGGVLLKKTTPGRDFTTYNRLILRAQHLGNKKSDNYFLPTATNRRDRLVPCNRSLRAKRDYRD